MLILALRTYKSGTDLQFVIFLDFRTEWRIFWQLRKHLIPPKPRRRVGGLHMPCSLPGRWWEQTCLKKAVHKIKTLPCDKQKEKNKLKWVVQKFIPKTKTLSCRTEDKLWDKHPYLALVNMHLR